MRMFSLFVFNYYIWPIRCNYFAYIIIIIIIIITTTTITIATSNLYTLYDKGKRHKYRTNTMWILLLTYPNLSAVDVLLPLHYYVH